jgi:hypothetical protein
MRFSFCGALPFLAALVSAQTFQTYTFNGVAVGPNDPGDNNIQYVFAGNQPNYGTIPGMYYNWQGMVMSGDREVYIIYYYDSWGSAFPSSDQRSAIENFISGISYTSYYNTAKKYYYQFGYWSSQDRLGNLKLGTKSASVVRVDCRGPDGVGCFLSPQNDISTIIQKQIYKTSNKLGGTIWRERTGQWINNNQALYVVISAPEITAQYGLSTTLTAGVNFCSYHSSFWSQADAEYFVYAFIPFPYASSKCILKVPGVSGYPNNNAQTDSFINYLNRKSSAQKLISR